MWWVYLAPQNIPVQLYWHLAIKLYCIVYCIYVFHVSGHRTSSPVRTSRRCQRHCCTACSRLRRSSPCTQQYVPTGRTWSSSTLSNLTLRYVFSVKNKERERRGKKKGGGGVIWMPVFNYKMQQCCPFCMMSMCCCFFVIVVVSLPHQTHAWLEWVCDWLCL